MVNGWKQAAAIAALAIGLVSPSVANAQTKTDQTKTDQTVANQTATRTTANQTKIETAHSRIPALAGHIAKAEQYFQSGDHVRGLNHILPYVFAGNMQRGGMAGEAVKDLLTRYPDAMAAFKKNLYFRVQDFDYKGEAVAVSRLIDWAFLEGLIGLTEHRSLQKSIAVRVRDSKLFWRSEFLVSDPYQEVPGLTDPDMEREIFRKSIKYAKEYSAGDHLPYMLLTYASAHRDEREVVETLLNEWPNLKMSFEFRRKVEELYPFITGWREPPDAPRPLNTPSRSIRIERLVIQQQKILDQIDRSRSQLEESQRQAQRDQEERQREASRREEDSRNEEARRRGLERAQDYARQNEERMRETERQRQEAERRREEEHRQFAERARQQAEAKAAEERRQLEIVRENTRRMEEERARRDAEDKRRREEWLRKP